MRLRHFSFKLFVPASAATFLCIGLCIGRGEPAGAGEPTCQVAPEPSCAVERKVVFVPVPLCHGLKCMPRPWFMTVEPPRADVLEAVAIRREQATVRDEEMAFRIVQDRQATQRDVPAGARESSCTSSRRDQPAAPSEVRPSETTCETAGERVDDVQRQLNSVNKRVELLDQKIDALISVVKELAPSK